MWLPAHVAFALLVCLPLVARVREGRALAVAYVAFFSVLPDFIHLGDWRIVSHSLAGWTAITLACLLVLHVMFRPRPMLLAIGALASACHLLSDFYIGSIFPLWPWGLEYVGLHNFNSDFDMRAEAVLIALAFIALLAMRPVRSLSEVPRLPRAALWNIVVLMAPFGAMALAETLVFLDRSPSLGATRLIALAAFLLIAALSAAAGLASLAALTRRPWGGTR